MDRSIIFACANRDPLPSPHSLMPNPWFTLHKTSCTYQPKRAVGRADHHRIQERDQHIPNLHPTDGITNGGNLLHFLGKVSEETNAGKGLAE